MSELEPGAAMEPYSSARHVLVCTGNFCTENRAGRAIYARLASLLQREGLLFGATRVKRCRSAVPGDAVFHRLQRSRE